uniref:KOW domain-containing protein n=1 Tax=Spongospora subterranea TaxID=70186 RepID=A0A0H5R5M3_9EUKA|eukprot:CRZ09161.1 hypothetical protein [Spongospora subterranea]
MAASGNSFADPGATASINVESWLNQRVFIRKGRYVGHLGHVTDFYHGKFRVLVGDDTVNKNASQLEIFDPSQHLSTLEIPGLLKTSRTGGKAAPSLIGSRVRILTGKFNGYCGFVSKGGNGYFAVEIEGGMGDPSATVMKRSSELVILSGSSKLNSGEVSSTTGEDVRKAAVILLNLMRPDSPAQKNICREPDACDTIEGCSTHC